MRRRRQTPKPPTRPFDIRGNTCSPGVQNTACGRLQQDSAAFLATLPSPDKQLTSLLTSSLDQFAASASACLTGDMATSVDDEVSAMNELQKAETRELTIAGP